MNESAMGEKEDSPKRGAREAAGAGFSLLSPRNLKAPQTSIIRRRLDIRLFDMRLQIALADFVEKCLHLLGRAAGQQLYTSVGQIAHPAGNIEAAGDVFHRPAEADALHAAFVENATRDHGMTGAASGSGASTERRYSAACSGQTLLTQ